VIEHITGDGQVRAYQLVREGFMICRFYNEEDYGNSAIECTGWCTWILRENIWHVSNTSKGEGRSIARPGFGSVLNEIHLQLIAEEELV